MPGNADAIQCQCLWARLKCIMTIGAWRVKLVNAQPLVEPCDVGRLEAAHRIDSPRHPHCTVAARVPTLQHGLIGLCLAVFLPCGTAEARASTTTAWNMAIRFRITGSLENGQPLHHIGGNA